MKPSLEPKYSVFESVEQILAPETISKLLSQPVTQVDIQPMNGHSGLAGGKLSYVNTNVGQIVLKQMSVHSDWIMFASDDRQCRSITLWQYGLLDQLQPYLDHNIIACARDHEGWAILSHDLTGRFFAWDKPMSVAQTRTFLDVLAGIHAAFWSDPCLNDAALGLCDTLGVIDQTSPTNVAKINGQDLGVLPVWIKEGWEVMENLLDPDVFSHMCDLIEDTAPLCNAVLRYPHTLLHGDYRAANLAYSDRPVVIDWQEASCSLMTVDLTWFVKQGYVMDGMGQARAIHYYRERLETYLHQPFENTEWQAMLDLGFLIDALRSTCFAAYWYKQHAIANNTKDRDSLEHEVKLRNQQVRDAMRWLGK